MTHGTRTPARPLLHVEPKAPDPDRFSKFSPEPRAVIPDDAPTEFEALTTHELIEKARRQQSIAELERKSQKAQSRSVFTQEDLDFAAAKAADIAAKLRME